MVVAGLPRADALAARPGDAVVSSRPAASRSARGPARSLSTAVG